MSKELDRLEHLRLGIQYINQDKSPAFISHYEEDINIIETALKEYLQYEKLSASVFGAEKIMIKHHIESFDELDKKIKALEIIKRDYYLVAECLDKYNSFEEMQKDLREQCPFKTQEEYDLVKEVLL